MSVLASAPDTGFVAAYPPPTRDCLVRHDPGVLVLLDSLAMITADAYDAVVAGAHHRDDDVAAAAWQAATAAATLVYTPDLAAVAARFADRPDVLAAVKTQAASRAGAGAPGPAQEVLSLPECAAVLTAHAYDGLYLADPTVLVARLVTAGHLPSVPWQTYRRNDAAGRLPSCAHDQLAELWAPLALPAPAAVLAKLAVTFTGTVAQLLAAVAEVCDVTYPGVPVLTPVPFLVVNRVQPD